MCSTCTIVFLNKLDSPAYSLMPFLLARYITYGSTFPKCVFFYFFLYKLWLGSIDNDGTAGHVDSIKLLLNNPKYANHNSEEHLLVRLSTTAM